MKWIITSFILLTVAVGALCLAWEVAFTACGSLLEFIGNLIDPRKHPGGRDISRESSRQDIRTLVGKTGTAQTPFRPSGFVLLDGNRHEATTEGEFLETGEEVEIIKTQGNNLVVRKA